MLFRSIRAAIEMEISRDSTISFPATFTASTYREQAVAVLKGYKHFIPQREEIIPLSRFLVWLLKELTTKDPGAVDANLNSWIANVISLYPLSASPKTYESLVEILPRLEELDGAINLMSYELRRIEMDQIAERGGIAGQYREEAERRAEIKKAIDRALVYVGLNRLINHVKLGYSSEEDHSSHYWFLVDEGNSHSFTDALQEWGLEDRERLIDLAATFLVTPEPVASGIHESGAPRSPKLNLANLFRLVPKDVVAAHQYNEPTSIQLYSTGTWERSRAEAEMSLHAWKSGGLRD